MKKWIVMVMVIVLVAILAGCAATPGSIRPSYVSELTYMNYTCEQLTSEQVRLAAILNAVSDAQRQARTADTIGVILIGVPTASLFGGNKKLEIARLKGELQALQVAGDLKNCNLPLIPDPTVKKKK